MIALIGASGYIGSQFASEFIRRDIEWNPVPHGDALKFIRNSYGLSLVINCAAFIPPESVALCDQHQNETIQGNVVLPALLSQICGLRSIPFAHISTGCLWNDGMPHREDDSPQRAFNGHCGFYIGTKWMAEEIIRERERHYIWRVRLPFDEHNHLRNYLSKLIKFDEVYDHENTLSHRGDFVKACLDLWENGAPYGTYNVMNRGSIKAADVCRILVEAGLRNHMPGIILGPGGDAQPVCDKLIEYGVAIRSVHEAVIESIANWKWEPKHV